MDGSQVQGIPATLGNARHRKFVTLYNMRAVFVRHGEKYENGPDDMGLTHAGKVAATGVGTWLAAQGIDLTHVVRTTTLRTTETTEALIAGWQAATGRDKTPQVTIRNGLPTHPDKWSRLLSELHLAGAGPDVVLVGHIYTQYLVENTFGGRDFRVPTNNRGAAFLLEVVGQEWRVTSAYQGAPMGRP